MIASAPPVTGSKNEPPKEKKPRKARMVIAYYAINCGGRPCRLDRMLHKDGVLAVCAAGEEPVRYERDWDSSNPLGSARNAADAAIRRTLETAKELRGSMLTEMPRVKRFLAQFNGAATLELITTKEPNRNTVSAVVPAGNGDLPFI